MNEGMPTNTGGNGLSMAKKVLLSFSNGGELPTRELVDKLTVGQQVGDVVLDDQDLAPRHCTFINNNGVISVIDHNGNSGTKINGHAIPTGKMFILKQDDVISAGKLNIKMTDKEPLPDFPKEMHLPEDITPQINAKINAKNDLPPALENTLHTIIIEDIPDLSSIPDLPPSVESTQQTVIGNIPELGQLEEIEQDYSTPERVEGQKMVEDLLANVAADEQTDQAREIVLKESERKELERAKQQVKDRSVASSFPRIFAIVFDSIWTYSLITILTPYVFFDQFMQAITKTLETACLTFYTVFLEEHIKPYILAKSEWIDIVGDAWNYVSVEFNLTTFLALYLALRLISTMIFSVSLGGFMLGLQTQGNVWWSRLGGSLREILAWVTSPFIIPDSPTIFGVKSLKELLTFSPIKSPVLWKMVLRLLIFTPLMLLLMLTAPFYKGFQMTTPKVINTAPSVASPITNIKLASYQGSKYLNMVYPKYDKHVYLPEFSMKVKGESKAILPKLLVYNSNTKKEISIAKKKKFSWRNLVQEAGHGDFLFQKNYPKLYGFAWDAAHYNKVFKAKLGDKDVDSYFTQLFTMVDSSLSLTLSNVVDHIKTKGPFYHGLLGFRDSLESLFGESVEIEKVKLGNSHFFMAKSKDKSTLRVIPILREDSGVIYEVTSKFGSNDELVKAAKSFFTTTSTQSEQVPGRTIAKYSPGDSIDYFMNKSDSDTKAMMEYLYGHFFRVSAHALNVSDKTLQTIVLSRIDEVLRFLKLKTKDVKTTTGSKSIYAQVEPEDRLIQRLNEIVNAMKNQDYSYFGIKRLGAL